MDVLGQQQFWAAAAAQNPLLFPQTNYSLLINSSGSVFGDGNPTMKTELSPQQQHEPPPPPPLSMMMMNPTTMPSSPLIPTAALLPAAAAFQYPTPLLLSSIPPSASPHQHHLHHQQEVLLCGPPVSLLSHHHFKNSLEQQQHHQQQCLLEQQIPMAGTNDEQGFFSSNQGGGFNLAAFNAASQALLAHNGSLLLQHHQQQQQQQQQLLMMSQLMQNPRLFAAAASAAVAQYLPHHQNPPAAEGENSGDAIIEHPWPCLFPAAAAAGPSAPMFLPRGGRSLLQPSAAPAELGILPASAPSSATIATTSTDGDINASQQQQQTKMASSCNSIDSGFESPPEEVAPPLPSVTTDERRPLLLHRDPLLQPPPFMGHQYPAAIALQHQPSYHHRLLLPAVGSGVTINGITWYGISPLNPSQQQQQSDASDQSSSSFTFVGETSLPNGKMTPTATTAATRPPSVHRQRKPRNPKKPKSRKKSTMEQKHSSETINTIVDSSVFLVTPSHKRKSPTPSEGSSSFFSIHGAIAADISREDKRTRISGAEPAEGGGGVETLSNYCLRSRQQQHHQRLQRRTESDAATVALLLHRTPEANTTTTASASNVVIQRELQAADVLSGASSSYEQPATVNPFVATANPIVAATAEEGEGENEEGEGDLPCEWTHCRASFRSHNSLYDHVSAKHLEVLRPAESITTAAASSSVEQENVANCCGSSEAATKKHPKSSRSSQRRRKSDDSTASASSAAPSSSSGAAGANTRFRCKWSGCQLLLKRGDSQKRFDWLLEHFTTRHAPKAHPFKCLLEGCTLRFRSCRLLHDHLRSAHDDSRRANTQGNGRRATTTGEKPKLPESCYGTVLRTVLPSKHDAIDTRTIEWIRLQLAQFDQLGGGGMFSSPQPPPLTPHYSSCEQASSSSLTPPASNPPLSNESAGAGVPQLEATTTSPCSSDDDDHKFFFFSSLGRPNSPNVPMLMSTELVTDHLKKLFPKAIVRRHHCSTSTSTYLKD